MLGEHRELHAIWSILINNKKEYAQHPETLRWKGKQKALFLRHEQLVVEILRRRYQHHSPLDASLATGEEHQNILINSYEEQLYLLQKKKCECKV